MKKLSKFFAAVISISILPQILFALTDHTNTVSNLKEAIYLQESFFYILLLSFLAGIFISLTPCVYPMIPITAGILQTQASASFLRNFLSALFYVLGLAVVYASLGLISATTSIIFGQWTTNPFFIFSIVILFIYLAFSLFGFYEIRIPAILNRSPQDQMQGSIFKSFLLGFFSGAIASPCITPALAALLTFVAEKGNPLLGFLALFCFALGMGMLLVIIGTFSTILNILPGSGEWMLEIKKILGFIMLAMAIYFARPLLSSSASKILYLIISLGFLAYIALTLFKFLKQRTPRDISTTPHSQNNENTKN